MNTIFLFSFVFVLFIINVESSSRIRKINPILSVKKDRKDTRWTDNESSFGSIISKGVKFYLFTKKTGESHYTEIEYGNVSSIVNSTFGFKKSTKIIIHGWPDSAFGDFQTVTRKAYLSSSLDVNIIAVDWSSLSWFAKLAFVPVGKFVGSVIDWMVTDAGVSLDLLHVMGHSVGAQIAGIVGEHVSVGKVGRVTGLDPSLGFGSSPSGRLDSTDGQFVDVIHTCGGLYSYFEPCGDVDFYPNRGRYDQPGCIIDFGLCSHLRAFSLFAESISSEAFVARACDSWSDYVDGVCDNNATAIMGERVDTSVTGKFYLHTAGSSPYALGNNTSSSS